MFKKLNLIIVLVVVLFNCQAQHEQTKVELVRNELFKGQLAFSINGESQKVPLLVEDFIIDGGQKIPSIDFAFEGLMIIQLRGGELTTIENNKKVERLVNEFWIVPMANPLQISTSDDSAIIRTYLIGKEYVEMIKGKPVSINDEKLRSQYAEISKNLFAKEAQLIGDVNKPLVRFIDLNIGPGKITESTLLPGASLIQITSGGEELLINDMPLEKGLGATLAIEEGEKILFDNRKGQKPVKIRAVVFLK